MWILTPNPAYLNELIEKIAHDGKEHFHVIADFDRTLTKGFVDGKPKTALITMIQDKGYLWTDFTEWSKKNFDTYHPIEIDPNVPLETKKEAMRERRTKQNKLLIKSGLTKATIKNVVQEEEIPFRDGCRMFFYLLKNNEIPLLIFSASGMWYDGIYYSLEKIRELSDNIDIISNAFVRDEEGKAIGVREPIIHTFNKDETVVKNFPIYEKIKERKNILLIGDSLGDVHMADGFDYENIIKIWFLNNDTPGNRVHFQEKFDMVIVGDGSMDEVNLILRKILK